VRGIPNREGGDLGISWFTKVFEKDGRKKNRKTERKTVGLKKQQSEALTICKME
jgi:hypothetical protein